MELAPLVILILFGGGALLLRSMSRISALEYRLRLVEEELRRRIAAERVAAGESNATPPVAQPAPHPVPEPQPAPEQPAVAEPVRATHVAAPAAPAQGAQPKAAAPAPVAKQPRRGFVLNFEELFGRKLPIWAGGITLAIAGVLIVKYAIDLGLFARIFTPGVQAVCGMLFGFALIGGAEWAWRQRDKVQDPRVSQALSGAGISTLYASLLVAANVYHLIAPLTAFFGLAAVTAGALALSLRHGMPSAVLGLAGGLSAPALTVGLDADVPMLAVYLGFTIAALAAVSRMQRWLWLAVLAMLGGAGWSLWLILAGKALETIGAVSVGGFVILLAILIPLFALSGAAQRLLRALAAVVGASQLALLVAVGGFEPLQWGLFVLIVAAGQWLAWRDRELAIVPTLSLALSVLLLLVWPHPEGAWLAGIGLSLGVIHAVPLLLTLWTNPPRLQRAAELSAIALAAPILALDHFHAPWGATDLLAARAAVGGALLALLAAALGWKVPERRTDGRFALLLSAGGVLLTGAAWLAMPHWQAPLWAALVTVALAALGGWADDERVERLSANFGAIALWLLLTTAFDRAGEYKALIGWNSAPSDGESLLRWAALALAFATMAWRARTAGVRSFGEAGAAALGYGALAQVLPSVALPLAPPLALLACASWSRGRAWPEFAAALATLGVLTFGWAAEPAAHWLAHGLLSLSGIPMSIDAPALAADPVMRRLLVPALLFGGAVALQWRRAPRLLLAIAGGLAGLMGLIALHTLYRHGFAAVFGTDFIATGLAERLTWCALLLVAGWTAWKYAPEAVARRAAPTLAVAAAAHILWYSLVLHNPLWSAQAVGPVPLANLLAPLFAALPLGLALLGRWQPGAAKPINATLQYILMLMIGGFAWASLRHAFHPDLLVAPGLGQAEDILRSLLGIALAVGYLTWGIRRRRHEWRIASLVLMLAAVAKVFLFDASGLTGLLRIGSFVALGFSLIAIGWLYSRQLRRDQSPERASNSGE